jgi:hypothetical protein
MATSARQGHYKKRTAQYREKPNFIHEIILYSVCPPSLVQTMGNFILLHKLLGAHRKTAKPANEVTTGFGAEPARAAALAPPPAQPGRSPSASACELHRETIDVGLSHGRNATAIWQDLVDVPGFAGGYQSVKRFVSKLRGRPSPEACVAIETVPG